MFLIYINDITDGICSDMRLFADDSIVYREITSHTDHTILGKDLDKLADWAKRWQMDFNVSKCYLLSLCLKKKSSDYKYVLSSKEISKTESHPYLGICIDSRLIGLSKSNK